MAPDAALASATRDRAELVARAMGTELHLVVAPAGAEALLHWAHARVAALEARWSRFLPDSELSRLNANAGELVLLSPDTYSLVTLAIAAWHLTDGRFDPTVLHAVEVLGYDRSFEEVPRAGEPHRLDHAPAPGCAGIERYDALGGIVLPPGVTLDLGGIGKGHAADLVAEWLVERGAEGACVSLGGDVRVTGRPPEGDDAWRIAIEHPLSGETFAVVALDDGAVATSSRTRRCWTRGRTALHHLVDPARGEPADSGLASVTVVSGNATLAEVLTKAVFVAGPEDGAAILAAHSSTGFAVTDSGTAISFEGVEAYLR